MFCPKCGHEKTYTTDTKNGMIRRRVRECERCRFRFFTVEAIESDSNWNEYKVACKQMGLFDNLGDDFSDKSEKKGVR